MAIIAGPKVEVVYVFKNPDNTETCIHQEKIIPFDLTIDSLNMIKAYAEWHKNHEMIGHCERGLKSLQSILDLMVKTSHSEFFSEIMKGFQDAKEKESEFDTENGGNDKNG